MQYNYIIIIGAIILLVLLANCILYVPKNKSFLIERFGIYHKTLNHGLHFKIPFAFKIVKKINIADKETITYPIAFKTKSNENIYLQFYINYTIVSPKMFYYNDNEISESARIKNSDEKETVNALLKYSVKNIIKNYDMVDIVEKESDLDNKILIAYNLISNYFGIKINQVEIIEKKYEYSDKLYDELEERTKQREKERQLELERQKELERQQQEFERQQKIQEERQKQYQEEMQKRQQLFVEQQREYQKEKIKHILEEKEKKDKLNKEKLKSLSKEIENSSEVKYDNIEDIIEEIKKENSITNIKDNDTDSLKIKIVEEEEKEIKENIDVDKKEKTKENDE